MRKGRMLVRRRHGSTLGIDCGQLRSSVAWQILEAMLETSARLLRLLSLLQTHRDWSGADLAERLGVTIRTVRRDVERLRDLGYPVDARPGVGGGYRLGAGAPLPPLLLDDEEAVAVAVGLRSAARAARSPASRRRRVRALAKLEQVLPSRLRHRVSLLQSAIVPLPGGGPTVEPDVLTAVAAACRDHQRLRFDYRRHDGTDSRRRRAAPARAHRPPLVPGGLGRRPRRLAHLPGRPADAADADRTAVHAPRTPGTRHRRVRLPRDHHRAYRYRCRLTVHAPAERGRRPIRPTMAVVTAIDDDRCEVVTGSDSLDEVAVWVGLAGFELTVQEPAELRERLADLGALLTRASSPTGESPAFAPRARRTRANSPRIAVGSVLTDSGHECCCLDRRWGGRAVRGLGRGDRRPADAVRGDRPRRLRRERPRTRATGRRQADPAGHASHCAAGRCRAERLPWTASRACSPSPCQRLSGWRTTSTTWWSATRQLTKRRCCSLRATSGWRRA